MKEVSFLPHQNDVLVVLEDFNHAGVFLDMGLGKTYVGAELIYFNANDPKGKSLAVCQFSKVEDWLEHFEEYYSDDFRVLNLRDNGLYSIFAFDEPADKPFLGVINYDLVFRRDALSRIHYDSVQLDESSEIKNSSWKKLSKRAKFFRDLNQNKQVDHWILLSGTPSGGKYEKLVSQVNLLGWDITEERFWKHYVDYKVEWEEGNPQVTVHGYKNVDRLKRKLASIGCVFMLSSDVLDLPTKNPPIYAKVKPNQVYKRFCKDRVAKLTDGTEILGDHISTYRLYLKQLCGHLSPYRLDRFRDDLNSTEDSFLVFYNWDAELEALIKIAEECGRKILQCNGHVKDWKEYKENPGCVVLGQYQSAAKGLDIQHGIHRTIFFSPTESSELFEQAQKRTHRYGQKEACFYYCYYSPGTIEERIYASLKRQQDYTDELFRKEFGNAFDLEAKV